MASEEEVQVTRKRMKYNNLANDNGHDMDVTTIIESQPDLRQQQLNKDNESENGTTLNLQPPSNIIPSFLVISRTDGKTFEKVSPFFFNKGLQGLAGTLKSTKRLRDGTVLVETNRRQQSVNLLRATSLCNFPILVTPHPTLNSSKGVVFSHDLLDCSIDELKTELASENVIDVYRVQSNRDGVKKDTGLLILTFNSATIPEYLHAGYLILPVREYIRKPMRCFNCMKYGHGGKYCKGKKVCPRCSSELHEQDRCDADMPKCCNCQGPHAATSFECPEWTRAKGIQEISTRDRIPFNEARKKFNTLNPISSRPSYSAALNNTATSSTLSLGTEISKPDVATATSNSSVLQSVVASLNSIVENQKLQMAEIKDQAAQQIAQMKEQAAQQMAELKEQTAMQMAFFKEQSDRQERILEEQKEQLKKQQRQIEQLTAQLSKTNKERKVQEDKPKSNITINRHSSVAGPVTKNLNATTSQSLPPTTSAGAAEENDFWGVVQNSEREERAKPSLSRKSKS